MLELNFRFSRPSFLLLRSEMNELHCKCIMCVRTWNPDECQLESERVLIFVDTKKNSERDTLNNLKSAKWNTKFERERERWKIRNRDEDV